MRIAIASSNGESVDQHFGQADNFLIYDVGDTEVEFVEDRDVSTSFGSSPHSDENLERLAGLLSDCSAVFVLKIGARSYKYLYERGVNSFEVNFSLHHIFKTLLKNKERGRVRLIQDKKS
jgi:predicted Fe-Mo cluster-binding NifX family protein